MESLFSTEEPFAQPWWSSSPRVTVVEAMLADPASRASALPAEAAAWWWLTHGAGDDDARERRILRLRAGLDLLIVQGDMQTYAGSSQAQAELEQAPLLSELVARTTTTQDSVALTYIEIVLVDDAGAPVPDEPYEVELPDGRVCTGRLDAGGLARVESVPVGPCVVRFPNCHRAEVAAA